MSKFLKIIFILLLVITLGELGYYVYILSANNQKIIDSNTPSEVIDLKLSDLPTVTTDFQRNDEDGRKKLINNKIHVSSILTDTFDGIIANINTKGGSFPFEGGAYTYKMEIDFQVDDKLIPIYFPESAADKIKVRQVKGTKTIPITLDDLQPGDAITMVRQIDYITEDISNNILDVQITKK